MKILGLKPTDENILNTYLSDSIGRNEEIFHFVNILNSMNGSCSISLEGKWGSGKTFFIKQVEMVLNANNDFVDGLSAETKKKIREKQISYLEPGQIIKPYVSVCYDAWENDNDADPVFSIVYKIMQVMGVNYSFAELDYIKAGTTILDSFFDTKCTDILAALKSEDPLSELKKAKTIEEKIRDFLSALLPEKGDRLIIFADELDRCSPSYAVRLLERIKHYFENENITFVFSVNIFELQYTIKKFYGTEFNGARYLDRFFDLHVQLPEVDLSQYYSQLHFLNQDYMGNIMCDAMIRMCNMQMREISRYLQFYQLAVGKYLERMEKSGRRFPQLESYYCLTYIAPIVIALKIVDPPKCDDFINGKDPYPLIEASRYLAAGIFSDLLDSNESYENVSNNLNIKMVTVEEKMRAVYEALFVRNYSVYHTPKKIGKVLFNQDSKKLIEKVTGMLSHYTRFDK